MTKLARSPLAVVLVVLALAAAGVVVWQTWRSTPTAGAEGQTGVVSTQWGPLTPADRDLLVRVRLAGLWERPTGQEVAERGTSKVVREVGRMISTEHLELDTLVIEASRKLGVLLPNQPTTEQQIWMKQISASTGANYDWLAVNLLRQAHGSILPAIATVRVGTRNELVRELADHAMTFVTHHIQYLEQSGLVDFARLDQPPDPPRAVVTSEGSYENVPVALIALAGVVTCVGLGWLVLRLMAARKATGRRKT